LLASALAVAAAVASLFGPEPVQRLVGSTWFLAGAGLVVIASLLAAVFAASRRNWPGVFQHLGLVVALVGVGVNQKAARGGYLFLEQGGAGRNYSLSRNLRQIEELPGVFALDSIGSRTSRGFRPAPVTWVSGSTDSLSRPVTYNRPLKVAGWQLLFSQFVEPGFLEEYEVSANGDQYLMIHNQVLEPVRGLRFWSFAYDAAENRVGFVLGREQRWLGIGDSASVDGVVLKLTSARFAANAGAIFIVNDVRFRFVIFAGFGLMLLGLVPSLFRRRES
jgi:hypothetical protein